MTGVCSRIASRSQRVIRRCHEGVIDDIISGIDLLVDLTLIVIPDPSAPSREHRFNAQTGVRFGGG
jgi:hypothetical protein